MSDFKDTCEQTQRQGGDPLLDRKAVAKRWGVSVETIKRREADGTLRAVHLPGGRLVRYRFSSVLKAEGSGF